MNRKRLLIICLALMMVFTSWPAIGMAEAELPDIKGHFAEQDILKLYDQGAISGYKDGKFYPNRQVTRAEFLRMLLETVPVEEWIKGPAPFQSMSGHWAYDYLERSYRSGLLLETQWSVLEPKLEEKMTRAEAALLLATAMELKASPAANHPFTDVQELQENETNAILALNQAGIIRGMTADTYGPELQLTRGQVSKILILVQQLQQKQLSQRLDLQAELAEVKGDVKVVTEQGTRAGKDGDILPVGTELQTGPESSSTLLLSDGDALYVDANSRLIIQELDIALQGNKSGQVQTQEFKILEEAILLRGKADEKNIGLNWQTDKKVNDFSIFKARNEAVDPSGRPTVKGSKSTKWLDTDIQPGHTYHYQVVGATGPNEGLGSKEISFEVVKKASFKLWTGNVLAKVKSLFSPSSKFEVQTPTTTAGVRGTTFSVSVKPDGASDVGVYSGSVALGNSGVNATGQQQVTLQSLQQATVAKPGNTPDVKDLEVLKTSSFIQENLAKVIVQEKSEQQQLQEKLNELEKKLQEKLGQLNNLTVIAPPEKPVVEEQKSTQETNDLNNVYQKNQSQIDAIVENNYQAPTTTQPGNTGSGGGGGGGSNTTTPTISEIPLQYHSVARGQTFLLPTSIDAVMSNNMTSKVNVSWSPSQADTSKAGVYTFIGAASGHTAELKLAVEAPLEEAVAVETNKPLAFAGGITIDMGTASIGSGVTVKVSEKAPGSVITTGFTVGGKIVDFVFNPPISLTQKATISLPLNAGADPSKSAIYYYNSSTTSWEYQSTVYKNGLLYATVDHFSIYGVLTDTEAPTVPTFNGTNSGTSVVLTFSSDDKSGIKKYLIYRDGAFIGETANPWDTTYSDMAVVGGKVYEYKVKAVDMLGNISTESSPISVDMSMSSGGGDTTITLPQVVSVQSQSLSDGTILINGVSAHATDIRVTLISPDQQSYPHQMEQGVILNSDGSFSFTSGSGLPSGVWSYSVVALNGTTESVLPATGTVEVSMPAPGEWSNHPPVALIVPDQSLVVGGNPLTLPVSQLTEDPDMGDTLSVVSATYGTSGIVSLGVDSGNLIITPVSSGGTEITAVVQDSHQATTTVTFNVYVTPTGISSPQVVSVSPGNLATGVAVDAPLTLRFDQPVLSLSSSGGSVYGIKITDSSGGSDTTFGNLSADKMTLTLYHNTFSRGLTYTVTLPADSVVSTSSGTNNEVYSWSFRTIDVSGTVKPQVVSVSPANLATEIAVDAPVTLQFDQPVLSLSSSGGSVYGINITDSSGGSYTTFGNFSADKMTLTLYHNTFSRGLTYTIALPANAVLTTSTGTQNDSYSWSFRTINVSETVKPQVVSVSPANLATEIAVDAPVTLQFDQPVLSLSSGGGSVYGIKITNSSGGSDTTFGNLSADKMTLTLYHNTFLRGLTYTITLPADSVVSTSSGTNNEAYSWSFRTIDVSETVKPQVVSVSPANLATGVAIDAPVTLQFDQPVLSLSSSGGSVYGIKITDSSGGSDTTFGNLSADKMTLTLYHNTFSRGLTYTVTLPANAVMTTTTGTQNDTYSWSFNTVDVSGQ